MQPKPSPRIAVVQINVTDMDAAMSFYCDVLGFGLESKKYYPSIIRLSSDNFYFILNLVSRPAAIDYPNMAQIMINIETPNIDETLSHLKSRNVDLIHQTPEICPAGRYAAFRDPFGNVLELIQFDEQ